jgi:hypothetical protein
MTTVNAKTFPEMVNAMTLRDYFAANAMQTLITDYSPADAAREAYEYADAMLNERAK